MNERPKIWQAPESVNNNPETDREKIVVSARSAQMIIVEAGLDLEHMSDKRILSVANGLSSLVPYCNSLDLGMDCYGVDPIYGNLGDNYQEFSENIASMNLEPHFQLTESQYAEFVSQQDGRHLVAGDGTKLPFEFASMDIVLIGYLLSNLDDTEIGNKVLDEALRVASEHGDIRIPDVDFVLEGDRLGFSYDGTFININNRRFLEYADHLLQKKANIYTTRNFKPSGHQAKPLVPYLEKGEEIDIYDSIIAKKDDSPPVITLTLPIGISRGLSENPPSDIVRKVIAPSEDGLFLMSEPAACDVRVIGLDLENDEVSEFMIRASGNK